MALIFLKARNWIISSEVAEACVQMCYHGNYKIQLNMCALLYTLIQPKLIVLCLLFPEISLFLYCGLKLRNSNDVIKLLKESQLKIFKIVNILGTKKDINEL